MPYFFTTAEVQLESFAKDVLQHSEAEPINLWNGLVGWKGPTTPYSRAPRRCTIVVHVLNSNMSSHLTPNRITVTHAAGRNIVKDLTVKE